MYRCEPKFGRSDIPLFASPKICTAQMKWNGKDIWWRMERGVWKSRINKSVQLLRLKLSFCASGSNSCSKYGCWLNSKRIHIRISNRILIYYAQNVQMVMWTLIWTHSMLLECYTLCVTTKSFVFTSLQKQIYFTHGKRAIAIRRPFIIQLVTRNSGTSYFGANI